MGRGEKGGQGNGVVCTVVRRVWRVMLWRGGLQNCVTRRDEGLRWWAAEEGVTRQSGGAEMTQREVGFSVVFRRMMSTSGVFFLVAPRAKRTRTESMSALATLPCGCGARSSDANHNVQELLRVACLIFKSLDSRAATCTLSPLSARPSFSTFALSPLATSLPIPSPIKT